MDNMYLPGFYFALWCEDQRSLQATRMRNITSDLDAGYSPFGSSVRRDFDEVTKASEHYIEKFNDFAKMTVKDIDEWCRQDLIRRGAISE